MRALLLLCCIALGRPSRALSEQPQQVAYIVESRVDAQPILAYTGYAASQTSDWQQVFNPTWVQPSPATGNRSGLLVRSQNCTPPADAKPGSCGPTCAGTEQRASWLTWAELSDDGGAQSKPSIVNHVTAGDAVFGPFDCENAGVCIDERGTEDPRLTYDAENEQYVLLYNAWGHKGAFLAIATTTDPTKQSGWTRHGTIFPEDAKLDGWPGKSGSIVTMASGPHYVIWSCARALRITPSVGRSMIKWDHTKTKILFSVRHAPFWDTGFVESAMPPLTLKDGNLLFFYDSVGPWNGTSGFQPGWAVLSGKDPSIVLARASVPPLPYTLPWEAGVRPAWPCNTRHVSNLGGKFSCERHGDSSGLSQCVPDEKNGIAGYAACNASCGPPPPPHYPMTPGKLYTDTDIHGDNDGSDASVKTWRDCKVACEADNSTKGGCVAFTFDNRTSCPEGACCWFKGPDPHPAASPGRLSMLLKK